MHDWLAHAHVHRRLHDIKRSDLQQVLPRRRHRRRRHHRRPRNIIRSTLSISNWRQPLAPAPLTTKIAFPHWKHKQRDAVMAATVNAIWRGWRDAITHCIWKHLKLNCYWKIYSNGKTTTTIRRWVHKRLYNNFFSKLCRCQETIYLHKHREYSVRRPGWRRMEENERGNWFEWMQFRIRANYRNSTKLVRNFSH